MLRTRAPDNRAWVRRRGKGDIRPAGTNRRSRAEYYSRANRGLGNGSNRRDEKRMPSVGWEAGPWADSKHQLGAAHASPLQRPLTAKLLIKSTDGNPWAAPVGCNSG